LPGWRIYSGHPHEGGDVTDLTPEAKGRLLTERMKQLDDAARILEARADKIRRGIARLHDERAALAPRGEGET
jgi:hypothetical protein